MYKYHTYIYIVHTLSCLLRTHNLTRVKKFTREENEITCLRSFESN